MLITRIRGRACGALLSEVAQVAVSLHAPCLHAGCLLLLKHRRSRFEIIAQVTALENEADMHGNRLITVDHCCLISHGSFRGSGPVYWQAAVMRGRTQGQPRQRVARHRTTLYSEIQSSGANQKAVSSLILYYHMTHFVEALSHAATRRIKRWRLLQERFEV